MKNVVALILAGGRSTEYGVLTQNRVKGALNFASNFRIIDFALSNLRNSGIDKVGLIIQYLPSSLIEHVGEGRAWDLHGYGRALKLMPPFVGTGSTSWYRGTAEAVSRNMSFVDDLKPTRSWYLAASMSSMRISIKRSVSTTTTTLTSL